MFRFTVLCVAIVGSMVSAKTFYGSNYGSYIKPISFGSTIHGANYVGSYPHGSSNVAFVHPFVYRTAVIEQPSVHSYEQHGPFTAAVQSRHTVQTYDVPSTYSASPVLNVEVPSSSPSMNFLMKSRSSNINVETVHESTPGLVKESSVSEEPHVNRHTITRPIVQEVREVISPYRKITQEVQPVQEEMETILARGQAAQERVYTEPIATTAYIQPFHHVALAPVSQSVLVQTPFSSGHVGSGYGVHGASYSKAAQWKY